MVDDRARAERRRQPEHDAGKHVRRRSLVAGGLALLAGVVFAVVVAVDPSSRLSVPTGRLGDSVDAFLDAVSALGHRLSSVELPWLGGALLVSTANVLLRSLA
jgi:hypothetical protein